MYEDQFIPQRQSQRDRRERERIQRTLNRLYWAFMYSGLVLVAYMVGWWQGYTG
jgi:hypothetical protein